MGNGTTRKTPSTNPSSSYSSFEVKGGDPNSGVSCLPTALLKPESGDIKKNMGEFGLFFPWRSVISSGISNSHWPLAVPHRAKLCPPNSKCFSIQFFPLTSFSIVCMATGIAPAVAELDLQMVGAFEEVWRIFNVGWRRIDSRLASECSLGIIASFEMDNFVESCLSYMEVR